MNGATKHTIWALAMISWGSITLEQWNAIIGIACAVAGFIAAVLSIYSWIEKRLRKAREDREAGAKDRSSRRRHHLWLHLWLWLLFLLVVSSAPMLAMRTSAQTNQVEGVGRMQPTGPLGLTDSGVMPNWHGYTAWHALALAILGWITHANWGRLLVAYRWIQGEGGVVRILISFIWTQKAPDPDAQQQHKV